MILHFPVPHITLPNTLFAFNVLEVQQPSLIMWGKVKKFFYLRFDNFGAVPLGFTFAVHCLGEHRERAVVLVLVRS